MYLRNRSPTNALKRMTPFEAFYGKKPEVGHPRVFGCVYYALIPRDERKKLDVVSRRCVLAIVAMSKVIACLISIGTEYC